MIIKRFKIFESEIELKGTEPDWLIDQLIQIDIRHIDFNRKRRKGKIVCNKYIADDLKNIFEELFEIRFPIYSVLPISEFDWDDDKSCSANNTSCFNYRTVMGTDKLSDHAKGMAIDINPRQNPWVHPRVGNLPQGSEYKLRRKGTITKNIVEIFEKYGFKWGGNWKNPDYQHFYKSI